MLKPHCWRRRKYLLAVTTVFCWVVFCENSLSPAEDPAAFYNMIELVCSEGYSIQEHTVTTEDGYILTIYRIPNGRRRPRVSRKKYHYQQIHSGYHPDFARCVNDSLGEGPTGPPVLLSHGLTGASDSWVLQGSDDDLAFMLADSGYDVWFTNIRGNFYSRRHKTLKPSEMSFWDFSFHENGIYDMPATIDYILELRGMQKLTYIGHSMGTTMFFVMVSSKPEYAEKIQLYVALAPVGPLRRENFSQSTLAIINLTLSLARGIERLGVREFLPRTYLPNLIAKNVCAKGSPFQDFCYDLSFFFTGYHSKLFLRKKLTLYLSHALGGSSVKTFYHFGQLLDAPFFQWYDYGTDENIRRYAQPEPPEYNLKKMTIPTALYYSKGDYVSEPRNVANLKKLLPNVIEDREYFRYSHIDFLWAYNAKALLYKEILRVIDKLRNR